MKKAKYVIFSVAFILFMFVYPVSALEEVITRSYLYNKINEFFQPLNYQINQLDNQLKGIDRNLEILKVEIESIVPGFIDVPFAHWAANDIYFLVNRGVISGFSKTEFKPDDYVTRGQLAIMLVRAKNLPLIDENPGFTDLKSDQLEYKYIATAKKSGIINGYPDGTFRANQKITRGQMAKMIVDAFSLQTQEKTLPFTDVSDGYLFAPSIKAIAYTGVSTGYGNGIFKPEDFTSRAQVSAFIARAIDPERRVPLK